MRLLRPSRLKWVLMLLGSALFVAGCWTQLDGWLRWLGAGFFGLGVIASAMMLVPGAAFLKVTPEGFTVRSLFRSFSYKWNEIDRFYVAGSGWNRFVAFEFAAHVDKLRATRKIVALLSKHEAALPDSYGMKCEELVELLTRRKANASSVSR